MPVIRGFVSANIVACFDETPGGGAMFDINAPRNAPAKSPHLHMDKIVWHSDFFQYESAPTPTEVSIIHAALAGFSKYYTIDPSNNWVNESNTVPSPQYGPPFHVTGQFRETDITLVTHNLGYVPIYYVAVDGHVLTSGTRIQDQGGSRHRYISAFATSSIIGLHEITASDTTTTATLTKTYEVLAFRAPVADPNMPLFGKAGAVMTMSRGKIDSSKAYLRRTLPAESSFDLDLGRTLDIANGGVRIATGGTIISDDKYSGSFTAPPYVAVGI